MPGTMAIGSDLATTILLVEDEEALADSVRYALELEGFAVEVAGSGRKGLEMARRIKPDLVLLDVMLPEMSGLDVCREIRRFSSSPIVMLTARSSETDTVLGLELGADDYMTKPFSMRELVARIRANLRRGRGQETGEDLLTGGPLVMDVEAHQVTVDGEPVELRPKEFDLLEALLRRKGRLATRETLIDEVWGFPHYGGTKTLDVHIKRLREKIEPVPGTPRFILTVRGLGYKFVDE